MNKIIQGKQFECSKHKIDYRICCEECQEKHKKFSKVLRQTANKVDKLEIKLDHKKHEWCYWIVQGATSEKQVTKRLFDFVENKHHGGLKNLLTELGWSGGTIWQVNVVLIDNYNRDK